jgi:hypothetical protein
MSETPKTCPACGQIVPTVRDDSTARYRAMLDREELAWLAWQPQTREAANAKRVDAFAMRQAHMAGFEAAWSVREGGGS